MDHGQYSTATLVGHEMNLRVDTIVEEVEEGAEEADDTRDTLGEAAETAEVTVAPSTLNSDDEWDTDLDDEDSTFTPKYHHVEGNRARVVYIAACKKLNIVPSQRYLKGLEDESRVINVSYQGLGPVGTRAVATSLVMDTLTTDLFLAGNMVGRDGIRHISDMIRENEFIINLDLSENGLDTYGAQKVADIFLENENLEILNLSSNRFKGSDAAYIAKFLTDYRYIALRDLDLSHNEFGEQGGKLLGNAIGDNETLVKLNLSWNQIRHEGVRSIATGIAENTMLKSLDVSNNGVDNKSVDAIASALVKNRTLVSLNLSGNRIGLTGITSLFKGVCSNECLRNLKLTNNPITLQGPMAALTLLLKSQISVLEKLEIADACVPREFSPLLEEVSSARPNFHVQHGGFMDYREMCKSEKKTIVDSYMKDPVLLFLHFVEDSQLKLIEIFKKFDTDKSLSITHIEFKVGLQNFNCPMSDSQLDQLIALIDIDHDGEIDLGEFMEGLDIHRRRLRKFLRQMPSNQNSRAGSPTLTSNPAPTIQPHSQPPSRSTERPAPRELKRRPNTPDNRITPQITIDIDDVFADEDENGFETIGYTSEMADLDEKYLKVPPQHPGLDDTSLILTKAATLP